jgi:hypothetical protein
MERMMRKSKLPFALLVALVVLVTAGLAVADNNTPESPPAATVVADDPDAVPPLERFEVFRRPKTAGDVLPVRTRAMLTVSAQRAGADLDTARAVAPAGDGYVWVVAGDRNVCLAIPDPVDGFGVACRSIEDALAGRLWVGLNGLAHQTAGDVRVAVFAPDDARSIESVASDGSRRAIPVHDNVAFADVEHSEAVEMITDGRRVRTTIPGTPEELVNNQG